jgi:hypothetical protein
LVDSSSNLGALSSLSSVPVPVNVISAVASFSLAPSSFSSFLSSDNVALALDFPSLPRAFSSSSTAPIFESEVIVESQSFDEASTLEPDVIEESPACDASVSLDSDKSSSLLVPAALLGPCNWGQPLSSSINWGGCS